MKIIKWEYYKDNICTDMTVATFYNDRGVRIMDVYESRYSYYTMTYFKGIDSCEITYSYAKSLCTEDELKANKSTDVLYAGLIHACKKFEENYYKQVSKLVGQFD